MNTKNCRFDFVMILFELKIAPNRVNFPRLRSTAVTETPGSRIRAHFSQNRIKYRVTFRVFTILGPESTMRIF